MTDKAGAFNEGEQCKSDFNYLNGGTTSKDLQYTRIFRDVRAGFMAMAGQTPYPEDRSYKDAANMAETKFALAKFFNPEQIDCIWRTTAGCLWLGNVEFKGDIEEPNVDETGLSGEALDNVAELWQVDRAKLVQACHVETLTLNKKQVPCPRDLTKCLNLRDSMARTVYDKLFVWMIEQMSGILSSKTGKMKSSNPFIGVLDIFGFEFYPNEQLIPAGGQVRICAWSWHYQPSLPAVCPACLYPLRTPVAQSVAAQLHGAHSPLRNNPHRHRCLKETLAVLALHMYLLLPTYLLRPCAFIGYEHPGSIQHQHV